jgi:hypothetical protein
MAPDRHRGSRQSSAGARTLQRRQERRAVAVWMVDWVLERDREVLEQVVIRNQLPTQQTSCKPLAAIPQLLAI